MGQDVMEVNKGQVIRLPDAATGCLISCVCGMLWLTQENDRADYIITPESPLLVRSRGISVIEAITDCVLCIAQGVHEDAHDHAGSFSHSFF